MILPVSAERTCTAGVTEGEAVADGPGEKLAATVGVKDAETTVATERAAQRIQCLARPIHRTRAVIHQVRECLGAVFFYSGAQPVRRLVQRRVTFKYQSNGGLR